MPNFSIVKQSKPNKSFRAQSVMGTFDIEPNSLTETFSGSIEMPEDWNIGVIYGNSGTGKSTIAQELFPGDYIRQFQYSAQSVIDDMPEASVSEIAQAFNSVGFSSPPSWLKPYSVLSNGEKMRVDLARALLEKKEQIVFDEFTSVVDRNVAKIASCAIAKAVRKKQKRFIAVSCHEDILEWLEPDWVFCTNDMRYRATRGLLRRPSITINIHESKPDFWRFFKKYHYMSADLNRSGKCYLATIGNNPVGFISIIHFPHPKARNLKRVHRLVVLPDYQGIGVGRVLLDTVGEKYKSSGFRFGITTSQPGLVQMMKRSPRWVLKHQGRLSKHSGSVTGMRESGGNKLTTSWELIG